MEASAVPRLAPTGVAALASPALLRLLSDDRLVTLIREGNANAFEALYDRHHRAILSFCRHMLGCADEAEDAVQHTFLAAYNDLVSSRKQIHLRAWLFTIARNRCLSILRARRDRIALEFEERATDGLATQVQRREDLRDLVVDINHLPDDQRAALVLAEIGALTHDEIGSVIGVPKGKVKALVFQARESLLASRAARDADCHEIREQLATMRGAALRRTTLRRHLRECQGCRDFRYEIERQRRRIAAILPVVPTIALRQAVLGATAGSTAAGAGVAGSGVLGGSVLKGLVGKAILAAMLAAVGTTGTILAVHGLRLPAAHGSPRHLAAMRSTARAMSSSAGPSSAARPTTAVAVRSAGAWRPATMGRVGSPALGDRAGMPSRRQMPTSGATAPQTALNAPAGAAPTGSAPASASPVGAPGAPESPAPTKAPAKAPTKATPPESTVPTGVIASVPTPVSPGHGGVPVSKPAPAPAHGAGHRPGAGVPTSSGPPPSPHAPASKPVSVSSPPASPPPTSVTVSGKAPVDSGDGSGTSDGGSGTTGTCSDPGNDAASGASAAAAGDSGSSSGSAAGCGAGAPGSCSQATPSDAGPSTVVSCGIAPSPTTTPSTPPSLTGDPASAPSPTGDPASAPSATSAGALEAPAPSVEAAASR